MKRVFVLSMLLVGGVVTPVLAQDADEEWCSGLVRYLDTETRLNLQGEVADLVRDGCVGYLGFSSDPDAVLITVDQGASSLTDSERIWCAEHDMTQLYVIGDDDDQVLQAAEGLGIAIPDEVRAANAIFASHNFGFNVSLNDLPDGWPDVLDEWSTSEDYARACKVAFELRR